MINPEVIEVGSSFNPKKMKNLRKFWKRDKLKEHEFLFFSLSVMKLLY
jgi:hypothetical protein